MNVTSGWQELQFVAEPEQVEALERWLFDAGALSISLGGDSNQLLLEPNPEETPLWDRVQVTALFEGCRNLKMVIDEVPSELIVEAPLNSNLIADREWARVWEEQFHPLQISDRLWVCPSWTPPPDPEAVNILLDPGLAFGTGAHPTTEMCLLALDNCIKSGMRAVDYGCGSGILGIAAAKLGAESVLGVDNDPQAITASRKNALANQVSTGQFLVTTPEDAHMDFRTEKADLVVANILARPLVILAPKLMLLLADGGTLILSGLLEDQTDVVIKAYRPWMRLEVFLEKEGWVSLVGRYN